MNWSEIENNQVKPNSSIDISNYERIRRAVKRIESQPLRKQNHLHKGTKFDFLA